MIAEVGLCYGEPALTGKIYAYFSKQLRVISFFLFSFLASKVLSIQFNSVQSLSHVRLSATEWTESMPGLLVHHQLPEFNQIHIH